MLSYRHIGAQEDGMVRVAKLEKCRRAFVLLLLAVQVQAWDVDVIEQLTVIFDRIARRKEHDDFSLLQILFEKREEQQEAHVTFTHYIALLQTLNSREFGLLLDPNVHGSLVERKFGKVLNLVGLSSGEKHCLPLFGQQLDDLVHFFLESDFQNAVRLINDEAQQVVKLEPASILHVV